MKKIKSKSALTTSKLIDKTIKTEKVKGGNGIIVVIDDTQY